MQQDFKKGDILLQYKGEKQGKNEKKEKKVTPQKLEAIFSSTGTIIKAVGMYICPIKKCHKQSVFQACILMILDGLLEAKSLRPNSPLREQINDDDDEMALERCKFILWSHELIKMSDKMASKLL